MVVLERGVAVRNEDAWIRHLVLVTGSASEHHVRVRPSQDRVAPLVVEIAVGDDEQVGFAPEFLEGRDRNLFRRYGCARVDQDGRIVPAERVQVEQAPAEDRLDPVNALGYLG
jgi:hypothetical protein